jgi:hypothetical protein
MDHTTHAATILADLTGLPIDHPALQREAARIAPRLTVTDPATLRAELVAEWVDMVGVLIDHVATITAAERAA